MRSGTRAGRALVAALAIVGAAASVLAADGKRTPAPGRADLSGTWRLDASRSDMPPSGGRGGPPGTRPEGGGPGAPETQSEGLPPRGEGGPGGPGGRPPSGGRMRLPDLVRIQMTDAGVRFADSTGAIVQEIAVGSSSAGSTPAARPDAAAAPPLPPPPQPGTWKAGQLIVESTGGRGTVTRVFALEDDGQTLVIRTTMDTGGDAPPRQIRRVYRKVGN
jgi:hypothetical protein